MAAESTSASARPAVAALALLALVMAASPVFCWAGGVLNELTTGRLTPWLLRAGPSNSFAPYGALLHALMLAVAAALVGAFQFPRTQSVLRLALPANARVFACLVLAALSVDVALDPIGALIPWWPREVEAPGAGFIEMFLALAAAPFAEELFFRGALQSGFSQRWGRWPATVVSALAFSAWHQDLSSAHVLFVAGLAYAWTAEVSGSIVPAMAAHALNNLGAILLGWSSPGPLPYELVTLAFATVALVASVSGFRRLSSSR